MICSRSRETVPTTSLGVPGIGPKTAAELLGSWNDLDGIYSHLADISRKRVRELLAEHEPMARLSRRLVQLDLDCDESIDPINTQWQGRDTARLHALYTELGFTRFAASLGANARGQGELVWDKSTETSAANPIASVAATESPATPNVEAVRFESFEALELWLNDAAPLQPWSVAVAGPDSPQSRTRRLGACHHLRPRSHGARPFRIADT